MRLILESTNALTEIDGVPVRVWNARTETGVECIAFVHRVAVREDRDASQFEAELREMPAPKRVPLHDVFDLRHIV